MDDPSQQEYPENSCENEEKDRGEESPLKELTEPGDEETG